MISHFESEYHLSDNHFRQAKAIIDRSRVADTIVEYHVGKNPGGAPRTGINYTLSAALVAALSLIMLGRAPTYKAILGTIADLTPRQLVAVGMAGENLTRIFTIGLEQKREYRRFVSWFDRQLKPLDPSPDQPAERITNAEHRRIVNARTPEQRQAYDLAAQRLRTVINDIVAGSIVTKQPAGAVGDIVADETIFDLAGPSSIGLGAKPTALRGACYFGHYYAREERSGPLLANGNTGGKRISKQGFGIGLTAVTRVGPPDQLHAIPAVIVSLDMHEPSSGSPDALRHAISHMKRNGLDTRPAHGKTWPRLTVDMGYNPKDDFMPLTIDEQYTPVIRYPKDWSLTETSAHPPGAPDANALPGPLQFAGAFYCPAAEQSLRNHTVPKSRDLLAGNGWTEHNNRLVDTLPFLMGTNSRPIVNGKRGRPRLGQPPERHIKLELVCPAVQLRVRCPLKPASMTQAAFGEPPQVLRRCYMG